MTDILVGIAIAVGLLCFVTLLMVMGRIKNSSAGVNEKKLDDIMREMIKLEAASGEAARLAQAQEARINDLKKKLDDDLKYISETTAPANTAYKSLPFTDFGTRCIVISVRAYWST